MRIGRYAAACFAVACCGVSATVSGQTRTLTLTDVMTRAREQAPLIVSARLALEEARGRLL
jgi:hypothetical protein